MPTTHCPRSMCSEAFTGGGSQVGQSHSTTKDWELTNNTSFAIGAHALKTGARLRGVHIDQFSPAELRRHVHSSAAVLVQSSMRTSSRLANGDRYQYRAFSPHAGFARSGIERRQIRLLGGGPSQFRLSSNPESHVSQWDVGGFAGRLEGAAKPHAQSWSALREPEKYQ